MAVAVSTNSQGGIDTPCGACRQTLREFIAGSTEEFQVFSINGSGHKKSWTLEKLLPDSFGPENLLDNEGNSIWDKKEDVKEETARASAPQLI